ncbi:hypothetical protein SAMN05444392_10128 [Seinonella peptonophila]|uniref:Uncharacterized protein n=2 Tax=Seinonella peptonophila TaxID=112248 RepID=A0A1M4SL79_9BACL|nr:hypothetical protein SAMN05444392_10128 [Seinonella peptonophila]
MRERLEKAARNNEREEKSKFGSSIFRWMFVAAKLIWLLIHTSSSTLLFLPFVDARKFYRLFKKLLATIYHEGTYIQ